MSGTADDPALDLNKGAKPLFGRKPGFRLGFHPIFLIFL
jgi:hypothetical protein